MRRVQTRTSQLSAGQLTGAAPLVGGSGCVVWHSFAESTGTAGAEYRLFDGPPAAGQLLADVTLTSGESTRDYIGLHALPYVDALFLDVVSGAVNGVVGAWADHVCQRWYDWHAKVVDLEAGAALAALGVKVPG